MGPTDLGNTEEYIISTMKSKANVCLVCIETIKRVDPVSIILKNNSNSLFNFSHPHKHGNVKVKYGLEIIINKEFPHCCSFLFKTTYFTRINNVQAVFSFKNHLTSDIALSPVVVITIGKSSDRSMFM